MNDDIIIGRMRAAGVPPHAYGHSLGTLGMRSLAAVINEGRYKLRGRSLKSFIISGESDSVNTPLVCAVLAKELVLREEEVHYVTLAKMVGMAQDDSFRSAGEYVVLGDLNHVLVSHWTPAQWDIVQSFLLTHLSFGGGLVIGHTAGLAIPVGTDLQNALKLFDEFKVGGK